MLNGKPLCIELFAGSFGWSAGWLALGGRAIGFDLEHLPHHGPVPEGAELVLQDVLTLHGSQFKDADVIFASPPCQQYSRLAMPWSRSKDWYRPDGDGWKQIASPAAKELRCKWETEGPDNRLFDACFRIQREAIEATGEICPKCRHFPAALISPLCSHCNCTGRINTRYIPLIVENVRGAQPWVGRSAWNYGSYHLWGNVPALMPITLKRGSKGTKPFPNRGWTQGCAITMGLENYEGNKVNPDGTNHPVYSDPRRNGGKGVHLTSPSENEAGTKQPAGRGDWFSKEARDGGASARYGSKSNARKAASAMIARIPYELSHHIAEVYFPRERK